MEKMLHRIAAIVVTISLIPYCFGADPLLPRAGSHPTNTHSIDDGDSILQRRSIWERYLDASPIERTDLHVSPYLSELEKAYHLDATQAGIVRDKLEAIATLRHTQMGQLAIEHDALADRAAGIWWTYREAAIKADDAPNPMGSLRDNPEYSEIRNRMLAIERQFPIDWDATITDVEALLPPEQAAQGRLNLHKNRIEHAARIAEQDARASQMESRQRRANGKTTSGNNAPSAPAIESARHEPDRKVVPRKMPREKKQQLRTTNGAAGKQTGTTTTRQTPPDSESRRQVARNLDRWETYTRDFVANHHLTAEQQAAALSIMTGLRTRAETLRTSHAEIPTKDARPAEIARLEKQRIEIDQRVERLFDQLTRRLEALLTVEQRRVGADEATGPTNKSQAN